MAKERMTKRFSLQMLWVVGGLCLVPTTADASRIARARQALNSLVNPLDGRYAPVAHPGEVIHVRRGSKLTLPGKIRLAIWNGAKGKKGRRFLRDLAQLARKSDLLLLQEALLDEKTTDVLQGLRQKSVSMAPNLRLSKNGYAAGVATLAGARPAMASPILTTFAEPIAHTPKAALLTRHHLPKGKMLTVANVHALNFVNFAAYVAEAERLFAELDAFAGPMVVAGDFNCGDGIRRERFRRIRRLAAAQGLTRLRPRGNHRVLDLDHVFVRGLDTRLVRVLTRIKSSDHPVLAVELKVP